ncbi:MAG: hypothetical protein EOO20_08835 [Chryseobacterium sp.]|nr:MAG: hypothetical protein EOO20_08835 [Chryseobacterium sp.]
MTNFYWPVYINLENEFNSVMFNIHIDDDQLNIYSSKISDLILRACIEIESIVKFLVVRDIGPLKNYFKFDEDGLKDLNEIYFLDQKEILISSVNCFQSERILKPFSKSEQRTMSQHLTYTWNNAYQNIKHDRASSLKFGSVKYLFDAMSALYTLNIIFKNDIQFIGKQTDEARYFDFTQGSSIFSIKLSRNYGSEMSARIPHLKNGDKTALFRTVPTFETWERSSLAMQEYNTMFNRLRAELLQKKIEEGSLDITGKTPSEMIDLINNMEIPEHIYQISAQNIPKFSDRISKLEFEAIVLKRD